MRSLSLLFIGAWFILYSILRINSIKEINNYLMNPDYNIDYQKELCTYKIIGRKNAKIQKVPLALMILHLKSVILMEQSLSMKLPIDRLQFLMDVME